MKAVIENREFKIFHVKEFMTRVGLKALILKREWSPSVKALAPSLHDYCTGYVQLPEGSKYPESEADKLDVHGGVTFFGEHPDAVGVKGTWVGFDQGHAYDESIQNHEEYAEQECEKLARQLREQIPSTFNVASPILTEEEKAAGWTIDHCSGNGYMPGCRKPYKKLNWHTPSGCPNCHATFVD